MIRATLLCWLIITVNSLAFAQNNTEADAIVGIWVTGKGNAHVEIKKFNNTYYGQIVWLKVPNDANGNPKTDKNNSDVAKRNTPLVGLKLLLGFKYAGAKQWKEGTIYDPENGKSYNCNITFIDNSTIEIRGYVGISLIGRTDTWKRIK
jgi:uncharacterized protein (DUF2147 family)